MNRRVPLHTPRPYRHVIASIATTLSLRTAENSAYIIGYMMAKPSRAAPYKPASRVSRTFTIAADRIFTRAGHKHPRVSIEDADMKTVSVALVAALAFATPAAQAVDPHVAVSSAQYSIGISGFVPVVCRATVDAVMVYAQKGHGRRSNLYTDYTFAVRDGDQLVTFAKAYSGLTDQEFNEVDSFVKRNSLEKFGPVRTVKPELVFEIAFEGIAGSGRHKSGVALRFPRISRWRKDKKPDEINTLADLRQMLKIYGK